MCNKSGLHTFLILTHVRCHWRCHPLKSVFFLFLVFLTLDFFAFQGSIISYYCCWLCFGTHSQCGDVFRCSSISSSYPCQSVSRSVGHTFSFSFYQHLWLLYVKSWRRRTPIIFRCASISSTYQCQFVSWFIIHSDLHIHRQLAYMPIYRKIFLHKGMNKLACLKT